MSERLLTDGYKAEIDKNFDFVRSQMAQAGGQNVILLAATKTLSAEVINYAIDKHGLSYVGENRVQELVAKYDHLHKDGLHIHFIGRLQRNKVKYIVDKVEMIHSLDSIALAAEIDRQSAKHERTMDVLVEVNVGNEESKGGITKEQLPAFLEELKVFKNIRVRGMMVIPPPADDEGYKKYFTESRKIFVDNFVNNGHNNIRYLLSMGMSDSYVQAIQCGSDIVRIGSSLFGKRDYPEKTDTAE